MLTGSPEGPAGLAPAGGPKHRGDPLSAATLSAEQYDVDEGRYKCTSCGAWKYESEIRTVAKDKGLTWQGRLETQCQDCSEGPDDNATTVEWRKRCKHSWIEGKAAIKGHAESTAFALRHRRGACVVVSGLGSEPKLGPWMLCPTAQRWTSPRPLAAGG